jgi:exonuclease SbcC
MISRLGLVNWRSHLESKFDFSNGTNALLGSLGSGKTSVLDGICFGLFGTFPNLQMKKLKLDDVIMRKPVEKNRAEVEIQFQINGTVYSVKRVIEKGKGTTYCEIRENGKLLEAPNSQRVTEIVEHLLKVDYELFSKAIYSEQNALDYFLTIPKGQRMKKIDELLAIDKFEKSRANAVSLTNKIVDRKLGIESAIGQVNEEELQKNIFDLEESVRKLISEKEYLKKSIEKTSEKRKRIELELQTLQKIREDLELLKREERGIESALEETSNTIRSIEESAGGFSKETVERDLAELDKAVEKLGQDLKEKRESYETIFSELSHAKSKLTFLNEEKISKLSPSLKDKLEIKKEFDHILSLIGENVDEQLEKKKKGLENLASEVSATNALIIELNSFLQHLSSEENKCPICDSILAPERKRLLLGQKQDQLKSLQEKFNNLARQKDVAAKVLGDFEDDSKRIHELFIQIKDLPNIQRDLEDSKKLFLELSSFVSQTENKVADMKREIEQLEKQAKESESRKRRYEILLIQLKDYQEKKQRNEELKKQMGEVRAKIRETEFKFAGKDVPAMEEELKSTIGMESEMATKLQSHDLFIQEKQVRKQEYEDKLINLAKQKKEIQKLENMIKDLRTFGFAVEQTQIELRTNFVEAVNYSMNKLWQTLYPYRDYVAVRLNVEEGDYTLQLQGRDGRWVNVEGNVSGGERSIACLALRIAFALVLAPQLRILILDEPTANLDARAIAELATTLRERINEFIDQTFLITHQSELEDAVTGSLHRLERDKENDGITKTVTS